MKQPVFFAEYAASLKDPCAEEIIDLAVFRPLGYLFVKLLLPFSITPNQVSFMAMACGVTAGVFLSSGSPRNFMIGGLLYGLSNVFDCCDGMLARIKKNGTMTGRIVDGVVDYVTGCAVFTGLGTGLTSAVQRGTLHLPFNAWLLVIVAALSTVLHAIFSDYFRNGYLGRQKSQSNEKESESEKFNAELSRLNSCKGNRMDKVLIRLYLAYLKLQSGGVRQRRPASSVVLTAKPATVILWNLIGPSTHVSFFIFAAIFYRPMVFFFFVAIAANAWLLFLFFFSIFKNILPRRHPKKQH